MTCELINLRRGHVRQFDTMGGAIEKGERRNLTAYQLWETDRRGNRSLRLQVGSST